MRFLASVAALVALATGAAACRRNPDAAKRAYFNAATAQVEQGKYAEAIIEYRNAVQIDPNFGLARYKLAQTLARTGDTDAAFREYVRAADLLPDYADAQLMAGRFLLMARQFEDAQERARRVLAAAPRNIDAQILLGNALAGMRDLDSAVSEMKVALELDPSRVGAYTMLGQMQRAQGNVKAAEATFRSAVAIAPKSVNAHLAVGNFFWSTGRIERAEAAFKDALAINAKDPLTNHALATLLMTTGRFLEAERFLVAMAADPNSPSARLQLADYYVATARPADAAKILDPITKDSRAGADAVVRLAAIDYAQGHKQAAHQRIEQFLALQPRHGPALIVNARFLLLEGKLDEALTAAKASIASDPNSRSAYFTLGTIYQRRRDFTEAEDAFTQVLKLAPGDVDARLQLARVALTVGSAERAAKLAAEVKAKVPDDVAARMLLTRALIANRDFAGAESEIRPLLTAAPESAAIHALHGSLEAIANREPAARAAFTRALQLDADDVDAFGGLLALDLRAGRINLVRTQLDARLARTPDDVDLLMMAARTYEAAGDREKTEQTLRRIIELSPTNLTAYSRLARLYVREQRLDEARAQFEALMSKFPKSVGAQTMTAMILELQGRNEEAEKRYDAVLASNPRAAVAANNLAWKISERGGNLDVALQLAQTAKAELPNLAEVSDTLGWIYYQKGLVDASIHTFEEAVKSDANTGIYRYHLGLAYAQRGDKVKAAESLNRALRLGDLNQRETSEASRVLAGL